MNILLHGRFYPSVGGIETVAALLSHEWHCSGAHICIATDVAAPPAQAPRFPFPIHYQPKPLTWLQLMRWADIFVHINISLKALWPALIAQRPLVAIHEGGYYCSREKNRDWKEKLKIFSARHLFTNVAASRHIAQEIGLDCAVIANPYDDLLFRRDADQRKNSDIAFVGRLVSDKGCALLIQSLARLRERGLRPRATIIGDGPERATLEQLAGAQSLSEQVTFAGALAPGQVAEVLRAHNFLVVPSIWEEPFGIVALEGAASGCVVLASDGGALPEVVGPSGVTFKAGNPADLADKLAALLSHPGLQRQYRDRAADHLKQFHSAQVAAQYLRLFEQILGRPGLGPVENTPPRTSIAMSNRS